MKIPLQITGRNFELTEAIESEIRQKAEKLDKFYDRIMRCRVVVESPHRHRHQGKLYNIHIYMTLPGSELIVKRKPHEDLYVVIRDSFNAARRKLEDFSRLQRGDVKHHEGVPQARITSLFPEKGYGFLTTPEHEEIYFHEHSVINHDFKHLKVGMKVRFEEAKGQKGPQASTVAVI
jgi:ribosomal subunit interface protein